MNAKRTWSSDGSMTSDDSEEGKKDPHICNKEAVLAKITANIEGIHGNIGEIKVDVKEVNSQYRELLVEVTKVTGKLETFKTEVQTMVSASDKGFSKITKVISLVVAIIVAIFAYKGLVNKSDAIQTKVESVKDNQDTVKADLKKASGTRGIVFIPSDKTFDIKKHAAFADSVLNSLNK
jgi:peptidoglycan hydrolase CwlO-like protein